MTVSDIVKYINIIQCCMTYSDIKNIVRYCWKILETDMCNLLDV